MRRALTVAIVALLASAGSTGLNAYTIVTRDGHLIFSQSKPEVRGLQAFLRLEPHGQLAVIQEEKIDWERTEAANPPPPGVIAVPASATLVEESTTATPAPQPVEVKILGKPGKGTAKQGMEERQAGVPKEQDQANAQEAIVKLRKEYAQVSAVRDQEVEKKKVLETELAELQSRDIGYAGEKSSAQDRIRELRQLISQSGGIISKLESRLGDIRNEAVQVGGSID